MSRFKNLRTILLTSALTIGISAITSQNVFAATLNTKAYIVKNGDCLRSIAQKYGETLSTLRKTNNEWNDTIFPRQVFNVSVTTSPTVQQTAQTKGNLLKTYTVKSGDSLRSITQKYGETLNTLRRANNKWNDTIFPGQVLNVSVATSSTLHQPVHLKNKKLSSMIVESKQSKLNNTSVKQKSKDYIQLGNKKASSVITKIKHSYKRDSNTTYKASYTMNATAYAGGGLTAMGSKPVRNSSGISTIAVDPSVIPLGTKVYISGYGNAICSDTGGSIKGSRIDLYMNSEAESLNWGRKTVTLYIR